MTLLSQTWLGDLTTYELLRWVVNTNEVWTNAVRSEYYGSVGSLSNKKEPTEARR